MTEKEHFFWNKLLELAKEELTQATFDYYVLDTKLIKVQDNVATILLEEVKKLFWEKNMRSFILMAGFEAYNSEIKVEYVFDEALLNEANSTVTNNDFGNKKEQQTPALPTLDSDLNSKYTFDNFVQGDGNIWAKAAALAVSENLATKEEIDLISKYAFKVNEFMLDFFKKLNIDLIDFKIEFGKTSDGTIILADEISPDTCRFWDSTTHEKLDKDRFRRDMGGVEDAYVEIMKRLMGK